MNRYSELRIWNVGQGLFTMAPNDFGGGAISWTILDCGTFAQNTLCSTETILSEVKNLLSKANNIIDCIVISHQDYDHWSMLLELLSVYFGVENGRFLKKGNFLYQISKKETTLIQKKSNGIGSYYVIFFAQENILEMEYTISAKGTYEVIELRARYTRGHLTLRLSLEGSELKGSIEYVSPKPQFRRPLAVGDPAAVSDLIEKNYCEEWVKENEDETMFIRSSMRAVCRLVAGELRKYLNHVTEVDHGENEIKNHKFINKMIWGGANAEPGCRAMQYLMKGFQAARLILDYSNPTSGGFLEIRDSGQTMTDYMSYDDYNTALKDAKRRNITADEIKKNVTSVVSYLVSGNGWRCLLPGDLTVHAFDKLKEVLHINYGGESKLPTLLVAPHHGSGDTNFCEDEGVDHTRLGALMDKLFEGKQGSVVVSAKASKFGHPSLRFINLAMQKSIMGVTKHCVCYGDAFNQMQLIPTESSVYCTEALEYIVKQFQYTGEYYSYPFLPREPRTWLRVPDSPTDGRERRRTPSKRLFL